MREVLELIRRAGGKPLSAEAIAGQLGLSPEIVRHMLWQLVQRGRLAAVDGGCAGCDVCPLHRFCAGAGGMTLQGYVLVESGYKESA